MKTWILVTLALFSQNVLANLFIEVDPFAYGLNGYSLHVGAQGNGFRFQVGAFEAEYPDEFKENDDFDVTQGGYGIKLDYYGKSTDGAFIGIEYGKTTGDYELKSSGNTEEQTLNFVGIRTGYKYSVTNAFYVTPWIAIDKYTSDTSNIVIDNETYRTNSWQIFPTLHLGYEF